MNLFTEYLLSYYSIIFQDTSGVPNQPTFDNPAIIAAIVIILVAVVVPCIVWFFRNFMRIVMKKNYEWLNRSLKWVALGGLIVFLAGVIVMILSATGVI